MALNFDRKPYLKGYQAGLDNKSLDSCRFTKTAKRIAWNSGYQEGKAHRERLNYPEVEKSQTAVADSIKWLNICRQKTQQAS